ncbi:MAG: PhoU domain-containing protein [Nitriliruptor sp.]|uniref:phosphate uptake regulator PhoU n=1 Tax=Nitriliruptor sp. TaxID=2448056 RepID=UPI0034A086B5
MTDEPTYGSLPSLHDAHPAARGHFHGWLDEIDDELVGGALLVSAALPRVTRAWVAADRACIAETRAVNADVRERVRRVETQGFLVLAREAPVAGDLRRLVAMLRLVTSVERSAALLRHVAETLERVDPRELPEEIRLQAEDLGRRASEVFRQGVDAWRSRDGLAVRELDEADETVDALAVSLLEHADDVESPAEAMSLAQLARYWERIADHGVSFAQHSTFAVTGERVEVGD